MKTLEQRLSEMKDIDRQRDDLLDEQRKIMKATVGEHCPYKIGDIVTNDDSFDWAFTYRGKKAVVEDIQIVRRHSKNWWCLSGGVLKSDGTRGANDITLLAKI